MTNLVECKLDNDKPHRALIRFAGELPGASASQVVRDLDTPTDIGPIQIFASANWLMGLSA